MNFILCIPIFMFICCAPVESLIEGLYCGKNNCYEVLGLTRDASRSEIGKTYRQLAKKYHPDMHKTPEAKKKAEKKFTTLLTAYEVLKDEDTRKDYDYMLDNPDKVYGHYYRYYYAKYRVSPKVDARLVIAISITVISIIQYLAAWSRYRYTINYLITVPKYRLKAKEIAVKENLIGVNKKRDRISKEQIKEEEEEVLKKILGNRMDIRWLWKFTLMKEEYGNEEKLYLVKKRFQFSQTQWDSIPDGEKDSLIEKKLWIKENFDKWRQRMENDMKAELAESARYKAHRRHTKIGPAQLSLHDFRLLYLRNTCDNT